MNLYEEAKAFFEEAAALPRGKRLLERASYDQTFQFEVDQKKPFYVVFEKGKIEVKDGETKEKDPLILAKVRTDEETLKSIFKKKKDPISAHYDDGNFEAVPGWKFSQIAFIQNLMRVPRLDMLQKISQKAIEEFDMED